MAAVAGAVAVGIYTASADEADRQSYEPSGPSKSVSLSFASFNAKSGGPAVLADQRAAVERSIPALGPRADVRTVRYPAGCAATADRCGQVMAEPSPAQRCPLDDDPNHGPDVGDPRCEEGPLYGSSFGSVVIGDATVLHNLLNLPDSVAEQAAADGRVLVFDQKLFQDGKAFIRLQDPYPQDAQTPEDFSKTPPSHEVTADAVLRPLPNPPVGMFMTPQTAARLGLDTVDAGSVWLPSAMPTSAAEQHARAQLAAVTAQSGNFYVERGYQQQHSLIELGLTGFAVLVALGAAGIATGLASADSQQDLTTLAAVGAEPRIRRTLSGFQCGVIAAMGAVLGTVCGTVPAVALRRVQGMASSPMDHSHTVIAFPWTTIAMTLVGLPVLAVLLATVLTRSRITLLRRAG